MDFTIDGRNFRLERMPAFAQLHLSRKIAPLLPPLAPVFIKAAQVSNYLSSNILEFAELAGPFAEALSAMKDEDAEQVFNLTLSAVKLETSPGVYMPLWVPGARRAVDADMDDIGKLLPVVIRVIGESLTNFISGFLTSRGEPEQGSTGGSSPVGRTT